MLDERGWWPLWFKGTALARRGAHWPFFTLYHDHEISLLCACCYLETLLPQPVGDSRIVRIEWVASKKMHVPNVTRAVSIKDACVRFLHLCICSDESLNGDKCLVFAVPHGLAMASALSGRIATIPVLTSTKMKGTQQSSERCVRCS